MHDLDKLWDEYSKGPPLVSLNLRDRNMRKQPYIGANAAKHSKADEMVCPLDTPRSSDIIIHPIEANGREGHFRRSDNTMFKLHWLSSNIVSGPGWYWWNVAPMTGCPHVMHSADEPPHGPYSVQANAWDAAVMNDPEYEDIFGADVAVPGTETET